jgi:hypothetical protein
LKLRDLTGVPLPVKKNGKAAEGAPAALDERKAEVQNLCAALARSHAAFPVFGSAMKVHDRDDQDAIRPDLVENPVGEAMNQAASNIVFQYAERLGICHDARHGRLNLAAEIAA